MGAYAKFYRTTRPLDPKSEEEQLLQLCRIVWDGDLISKSDRDSLVEKGFAQRIDGGFNFITADGVQYLRNAGLIFA